MSRQSDGTLTAAVSANEDKILCPNANPQDQDLCDTAQALIQSRQNVSPKRLLAPGPDAAQLDLILDAAGAAPDHGLLRPWRFVIVPQEKRALLAEVFGQSLIERDPEATPEQLAVAREKAHLAPLLMLAIARLGPSEPDIPLLERMISLGAAVQNVLLSAHALGFGAGLTSGQAMRSTQLRALLALCEGEQAVCCINIGTVSKRKPQRARPGHWEFTSVL